MVKCPKRPQSADRQGLGFGRRGMVRWFDPLQLVETGLRTLISGIFGTYADKREFQAALPGEPRVHRELARRDEVWVDYVADLGDGWEPTYTIAYLLARPTLKVEVDKVERELPRGHMLVMGGDQVYPTASREEYENRTLGPYRAAYPCEPDENKAPYLFAIPGNHDWYDGLTNFLRFFCQQKWIGGWRTAQQRSYFAVQLPHRWWLWGVDVQFDVYIDEPQVHFFKQVAVWNLREGDKVILVTGKPSWKHGMPPPPSVTGESLEASDVVAEARKRKPNRSYENLRYLEAMITQQKAELIVSLSGDDHHYARYGEETNEPRKRQKITAGGGGAALSGTHDLAERVALWRTEDEKIENPAPTVYHLRQRYPSLAKSRRIPFQALYRIPLQWRFLLGVAVVYFVPAVLLQSAVRKTLRRDQGANVWELWYAAVSSKWVVYAGLVLAAALVLFAASKSKLARALAGGVHAAVHVVVLAFFVAVAGRAPRWLGEQVGRTGDDWSWFWDATLRWDLVAAIGGAVLAAIPGAFLVALYLVVTDRLPGEHFPGHSGQVFAAQGIRDMKNFLRLHVDGDGVLRIYPVGISKVARADEMTLVPNAALNAPWFELEVPDMKDRVRLIEPPITVM